MQKQLNLLTQKSRNFLRPKISENPKIHKFLISIHRQYCNMTGFLHVLPDFYIIGVTKGGTSALYDYLTQHPNIQPAVTKEPRFFDKYYDRGLNWYKIGFPFAFHKFLMKKFFRKEFITGEATPRYLDYPHAPQRIKKITPNAKFIILLRNPIDRIYSHYNMRLRRSKELLSLEDALLQEKKRTNGEFEKMKMNENYYSPGYFQHSYFDRSIYVKKIKYWMKFFPKEQFLIIQSEKFFADPNLFYKKILKFLNLPEHELKIYEKIGAAKYKNPKMDTNTRKRLAEELKPYNDELFEFLGTKFDWDK